MTRIEYIRQLPGMKEVTYEDALCPDSLKLDIAECVFNNDCRACFEQEATINGQPAPYLYACPVKPGQTVYIPYNSVIDGENCGINTEKVDTITFYEDSWYAHFANNLGGFNEAIWMGEVFPTREAAEKKLEEMKGEGNADRQTKADD